MHPDTSTFPEHEHLKCPRCDSTNTKFCYYNNYNLSQPRHFCKNCRRYWTKGGTLRNIPIGGGTRKISKRTSGPTKRASTVALPPPSVPVPVPLPKAEPEPAYRVGSNTNSITSSNNFNNSINNNHQMESGGYPMGPFGNLLMEGLNFSLVSKSEEEMLIRNPIAAAVDVDDDDDFRSNFLKMNENNDENNNNNNRSDGVERGDWNGGESGWPDLSIFTPGSSFH